jgi:hypothetical protein
MKVIFLDVDGVLINRASCKIGFGVVDVVCVANLNKILEQTHAVVVVSSCWRIGRTVSELRALFGIWGVNADVVDRTIVNWQWIRGQEITEWLKEHIDVEKFIILDDDKDMGNLLPYLIQTKFVEGLTAAQADEAIRRLNE